MNQTLTKLFADSCIDQREYEFYKSYIEYISVCKVTTFIEKLNNYRCYKCNSCRETLMRAIENTHSKLLKYDVSANILRINKNVRYNMTRSDRIDLTDEQKKGMKELYNFLTDNNQRVFGFFGFAGSGKTTTLVEFVSYMVINKFIKKIAFTAPTNTAVNVMKGKMKAHVSYIIENMFNKKLDNDYNFEDGLYYLKENGITIDFMTTHKLLKFYADFTLDGKTKFTKRKGTKISLYDFVIIDECSMVTIDMTNNIFQEIRNKNYKIIFSGDTAQLPPVNEDNSTLFIKTHNELPYDKFIQSAKNQKIETYNLLISDLQNMRTFLLQNMVRSKNKNVVSVCNEFRKWIDTSKLPDIEKYIKKNNGVYAYNYNPPESKTKTEWFMRFLETLKENNIIITWTNKQTDDYNRIVRRKLFGHDNLDRFMVGDILLLNEFYELDTTKLYTSEQLKVLSTDKTMIKIDKFDINMKEIEENMKGTLKDFFMIGNRLRVLIDEINKKDITIECWKLKVHKIEDSTNTMIMHIPDGDGIVKLNENKLNVNIMINNFIEEIMRLIPKKNIIAYIENDLSRMLWKQWNKLYVSPFANVTYGYSITCHKGQGSSFHNVYVDLHDILQNKKITEAKKCAYTALSRTSNELYLLI